MEVSSYQVCRNVKVDLGQSCLAIQLGTFCLSQMALATSSSWYKLKETFKLVERIIWLPQNGLFVVWMFPIVTWSPDSCNLWPDLHLCLNVEYHLMESCQWPQLYFKIKFKSPVESRDSPLSPKTRNSRNAAMRVRGYTDHCCVFLFVKFSLQ